MECPPFTKEEDRVILYHCKRRGMSINKSKMAKLQKEHLPRHTTEQIRKRDMLLTMMLSRGLGLDDLRDAIKLNARLANLRRCTH
jgi:hypothetical protein